MKRARWSHKLEQKRDKGLALAASDLLLVLSDKYLGKFAL